MIYLELFWSFFQVGLMSIGGGLAALAPIKQQVLAHGWLSELEFADVYTISEMTPGPIALNASTFVGTKMAGLPGALVATLGCITPSCLIVLTLAWFYFKYKNLKTVQGVLNGLRPAVVAMIIAFAGINILKQALFGAAWPQAFAEVNFIYIGLLAAGVVAVRALRVNPIYVIAGSGVCGVAMYYLGLI